MEGRRDGTDALYAEACRLERQARERCQQASVDRTAQQQEPAAACLPGCVQHQDRLLKAAGAICSLPASQT